MQNSNANAVAGRRKLPGLIVAGATLFVLAAYLLYTGADSAIPNVAAVRNETSSRFGPGMWNAAGTTSAPAAQEANFNTAAPGGLATTPDHRLVVNRALRDVIEYFLLGGHPGEHASHAANLLAHLHAKLPQPAAREAAQIVQNYLAYLQEHDKLLARESMPPTGGEAIILSADLDRISAWTAQRARLRQSLLGIDVAQIWFGAEEAETQLQIEEMRKHGAHAPLPAAVETNPLQHGSDQLYALRAKGASVDAQREHVLSQFGAQAAQRFDAFEQEEQAWQNRLAAYRREADRLRLQSGMAPSDRARQIDELLAQMFASEAERIRAKALYAQMQ